MDSAQSPQEGGRAYCTQKVCIGMGPGRNECIKSRFFSRLLMLNGHISPKKGVLRRMRMFRLRRPSQLLIWLSCALVDPVPDGSGHHVSHGAVLRAPDRVHPGALVAPWLRPHASTLDAPESEFCAATIRPRSPRLYRAALCRARARSVNYRSECCLKFQFPQRG